MADAQIDLPPEADTFVNRVRKVEGTLGGRGYVKYGGSEFEPGKDFPQWEGVDLGEGKKTHAAGPGQWQPDTWKEQRDKFKGYGIDLDFSNDQHQKAAIWDKGYEEYKKATGRDLREDLKANQVQWDKLAPTWQGFQPRVTRTDKPGGKIDDRAIAYEQSRPHQSVWYVDPKEMLDLLPEAEPEESKQKGKSLYESLFGRGEDIYDLPHIDVSKGEKPKITDWDGRHRLKAMIDAGLTAVPMVIKGVEPGVRPMAIEGMTGKIMPMRFDPVPEVRLPTEAPTSRLGQFASGARTALEGIGQFIGHSIPGVPGLSGAREHIMARADQESAARLRDLEAAGTTRSWPYIAGEVAATLPAAAVAPAAGAGIGGSLAAGAVAGTIGGIAEPVRDPSQYAGEKAWQAGIGALSGAALGGAGHIVGNALAPVIRPAVNALINEGVRLTPGQVLGGAFKRAEDVAGSVPVLNAMIRSGQKRALEDFNRAAWNRSLEPLGEKLPTNIPVGREAADYVAQRISDTYNKIIPKLKAIPDRKFATEAMDIARRARAQLPDPKFSEFWKIVKGQFFDKLPTSGRDLQGIDEMLGFEAVGYKADPSRDNRTLGRLLGDLQESFRDLLERGNPVYAKAYRDVREAFANNVRVERAAGSVGATNGVFTPAQLSNAVKAADPSARKNAFARGKARLQDLSDAAKDVLPQRVPDSGTPERLALMGVLGGAAHLEPHTIAAGAALSLPYTAAGMNALRWWMTHLPRSRNAMAALARHGAIAAATGTAPVARGLNQ